jgi:hypothetical protein
MNGYKEINYLPLTPSLAKVGVGGSNPLARSNMFNGLEDRHEDTDGPSKHIASKKRWKPGVKRLVSAA